MAARKRRPVAWPFVVSVASRGEGRAQPESAQSGGDEDQTAGQVAPQPEVVSSSSPPRWAFAGLAVLLVVGVGLRFWTRSQLWLDEALTVDIARLPIGRIPGALKHDGAPPLYYFLLNGWMRLFGQGDVAVRALSGVCSLAVLPAAWWVGRRVGGKRAGWAATILLLGSPFAIRFATETRMYSLLTLEATLATLAVLRVFDRPDDRRRMVLVAVAGAALLYTHYWSIYLLGAFGLCLLWMVWREPDVRRRRAARVLVLALAGSGILFLPWAPTFVFQSLHTGTPWAKPPGIGAMVEVVRQFSGGTSTGEVFLTVCLFALFGLGLFGKSLGGGRVELDLRTRPRARELAFVAFATALLAVVAGAVTGAAFAARYTSVLFPLFVVVAALGIETIASKRAAALVLAVVVGFGVQIGFHHAGQYRTEVAVIAEAIRTSARPGDLVVTCPDQLGPSLHRALGDPAVTGLSEVTFPRLTGPDLVDWVDYTKTFDRADDQIGDLADQILRLAGGHDLWVVWSPRYYSVGPVCLHLVEQLDVLRPGSTQILRARPGRYFEDANLIRYQGA